MGRDNGRFENSVLVGRGSGHAQHFLVCGDPAHHVLHTVVEQGRHALFPDQRPQFGQFDISAHGVLDLGIVHEHLENTRTAVKTCLPAAFASGASPELLAGRDVAFQPQSLNLRVIGGILHPAGRADIAHQTLGNAPDDGSVDEISVKAQVQKPDQGGTGVVGMQGGKDDMSFR